MPSFPLFRLALPLLLATAASAQKVVIEYDRSVDFSAWRKYDWKEHPFLKNHPETKQLFSVGSQLVQSKVNEILIGRGFYPMDGLEPEFYIAHFVTARLRQETYSVPSAGPYPGSYMWPGAWYSWSSAWFSSWDTVVENYAQGILILDVVDAKTSKLMWRAACKAKIDDMTERHKEIEDTVKKALKSFPPKFKPR
jgi:hypothetical protein